ncbi:hypothetical protein M514_23429 [Trichuris suis]|uniref:Uncharacterized protein n=1 Tax=Trichuris suis TaxID=68888 RepID=A0A085N4K9_9BILA|nr:hypothetical protein M514_23429 [Trichuris suis]
MFWQFVETLLACSFPLVFWPSPAAVNLSHLIQPICFAVILFAAVPLILWPSLPSDMLDFVSRYWFILPSIERWYFADAVCTDLFRRLSLQKAFHYNQRKSEYKLSNRFWDYAFATLLFCMMCFDESTCYDCMGYISVVLRTCVLRSLRSTGSVYFLPVCQNAKHFLLFINK